MLCYHFKTIIRKAHEKILKRLMETNLEPQSGYGSDSYTESAKEKIRKVCECPQADVWFLTGGTQTNQNVIDAMLQPYEGVVAASTGQCKCPRSREPLNLPVIKC